MVGFSAINNNSDNTTISGDVNINSNLNISGNSIIYGNTSTNNNFNILGNSIFQSNLNINSSLLVSGNTIINGSTTNLSKFIINNNTNIQGNLYVSTNTIINNSATCIANFNISGITNVQNNIYTNNINSLSNNLNINGNIINIGNSNSIINIIGTSNFMASNNLILTEKLFILNINASTGSGFDNGGSCGIEILGTSGVGFIQTTLDASRYLICPPYGGKTMYIALQDNNNNIYISGTSLLNNNTTIFSDLYVSGTTTILGSNSINSNLNILGNTILMGTTTVGASLLVSNNTIIYGKSTILGILNVSGNSTINGDTTIFGSLLVSGNSFLNESTTILSNLFVSGNCILMRNTTLNSSIFISGNTIINGDVTVNSIFVNNNSIFQESVSCMSNLFITNNTTINGSVTFRSNLSVSGNSNIIGNITVGSSIANLNIISSIISKLPEYADNNTAVLAGVPIWGWYRTGGILKIRLNNIPPTVYLSGSSSITMYSGFNFTDPGAFAIDYYNNSNNVYISSLISGNTNLLSTNILISGTSTLIFNNINPGNYTATYIASDMIGNIGFNYRSLNVLSYQLSMPGLIFMVSPSTYNSTNNTWIDSVNNAIVIPAPSVVWNSIGKYFTITKDQISNNLVVTSPNLVNSMHTVFFVCSIAPRSGDPTIIFAWYPSNDNWVQLSWVTNWRGNVQLGYTDGIQNKNYDVLDGKFHVFLATGVYLFNNNTLHFASYHTSGLCFPTGSRIAAIGILDHNASIAEIQQIQTWFNNSNFASL
jgi:predicted acyltransferase (DUF342 family)